MASPLILVVEDEPAVRDMIALTLEQADYEWVSAGDVPEARCRLADARPDLVLLDWMLPGQHSGLDFARQMRREELTRDLPVILLTARDAEDDKVRGLDVGADDYVTKPFSPRELLARIKALLRRSGQADGGAVVSIGGLTLDATSHRVLAGDENVALGPTEFKLLSFFIHHPDRVYSRDQLLDRVWGSNVYIDDRTVDVHVRRLRKALAPHGCDRLIQTVRGVGYRFSEQS
ncbi:MAG TPA: phosphate regulon transcriptional regulatory protein PhoB [Gammaproteobacteria bacterium]|nr:phosphate regulon transcriptional regulatory protein PhoB [Gammaproteobacteria bacterium]